VVFSSIKIVCNNSTILSKNIGKASTLHDFTDDIINQKLSYIPPDSRNNHILIAAFKELGGAWNPKYGNTFFGYENNEKVSIRSWCSTFVKWVLKSTYPDTYSDLDLGGVGVTQYMINHRRLFVPRSSTFLKYPLIDGNHWIINGYALAKQIDYEALGRKLMPGSYLAISPQGNNITDRDWQNAPEGSELGHKYNGKYYERGFHAALFVCFPNGFRSDDVNDMLTISGNYTRKVKVDTFSCWDFSKPKRQWIDFAWTSNVYKYNEDGCTVIDCFGKTSR
jgi:hypothetical protein